MFKWTINMTEKKFTCFSNLAVAVVFLTMFGMSSGIQNCAVWKEITPCTCKIEDSVTTITCENMNSFAQMVSILKNRFSPTDRIVLKIFYSTFLDLSHRTFQELNMTIEILYLNFVTFNELDELSFVGLKNVHYLSLADNTIPEIPKHVLAQFPNLKTLDLGRIKVKNVPEDSFKDMTQLDTLILGSNPIEYVDSKSIPTKLKYLHIGQDSIKHLNGTLRNLSELKWLFINTNELTTLDGELPKNGENLNAILASHNRIERLPQELKNFQNLESLFFSHNLVTKFDGALSKSRKLQRLNIDHNRITHLAEDDFKEAESLKTLFINNNRITALNGALVHVKKLNYLNMTHNFLTEFSLSEIRGLQNLKAMDLSYNRIRKIIGLPPNLVEWETGISQLHLQHNEITFLNGSLSGLRNLLRLNLSHNKLRRILPDDFIGLDQLTMLDVSHNHLTTLEETSKTFLPALEELIAHHNYLTVLDRDFHGLPVLCWADLSNNQIKAIGKDLVTKTHCKLPGIHDDSWGTLKIYLQDNPILCDAALTEIMAELEVNHTRISGVSQCPPLSEQPTTTRPSQYLGYLPDSESQAGNVQSYNYPSIKPIQPHYQQTFHSYPTQNHHRPNYIHDRHMHNHHVKAHSEPRYENDGIKQTNLEEPNFVPVHKNQYHSTIGLNSHIISGENGNTKSNVLNPAQPLAYKNLNLLNERLTIPLATNPLEEQPLRLRSLPNEEAQTYKTTEEVNKMEEETLGSTYTASLQEKQLNQLATQIEELRTKVEELSSQNQMLAQNLNQLLPHSSTEVENNITENSEVNVPIVLVPLDSTSTEKIEETHTSEDP